jgi:uncharacterized membrane protein
MTAPKQARTRNGSGRASATAKGAGGAVSGTGGTGRAASGRSGGPDVRRPAAKPGPAGAARPAQTRKARDRARARELAEQRAAAEPARTGPPLWLQYTSLVLALAGLGISIYLTIEHFTGNATLACSANGTFNCSAVTTSPQSMVFGVFPVAVLGLAFFVFMVPVSTPMAWQSARREIALARLGSVIIGIGFILYLIYVELLQVRFICLWCTGVHIITFLLFLLVAFAAAIWGLAPANTRHAR